MKKGKGRRGKGKAKYKPGKGQPMKDTANPTERNIARVHKGGMHHDGPEGREHRMAKRAKRIAKSKAALGDELL